MMCSLRSGICGGEFLILSMKHCWLNVVLVKVWILVMLVFTHTFHFLFMEALPHCPIDTLGIELGNILNMLIIRGTGILPRL